MSHIIFNGEFFGRQENIFSTSNRAYNYGDGVFESMRMTAGFIPFLNDHMLRLEKACGIIKMDLPRGLDMESLKVRISQLADRNKTGTEARIKLNVFRNDGGLYAPVTRESSWVLDVTPYEMNGFEQSAKGLKVDVYNELRKPFNLLSGIKSCNSLLYVQAGIFRNTQQLDECVILNDAYNVCEFNSSNLFIVINGVIYTPASSEACVEGVMRKNIIMLAKKNRFNVYEVELKPNDLLRADEIFLTNALQGVQWISAYKNKRYFNKVSKGLSDALQAYVREMQPATETAG